MKKINLQRIDYLFLQNKILNIKIALFCLNLHEVNTYIQDKPHEFDLTLHFSLLDHKKIVLRFILDGVISLECQNNLVFFDFPISVNCSFGFATDERYFNGYPENFESIITNEKYVNIFDIINQEISLGIPMVPKTKRNICQYSQNKAYYAASNKSNSSVNKKPKPVYGAKKITKTPELAKNY